MDGFRFSRDAATALLAMLLIGCSPGPTPAVPGATVGQAGATAMTATASTPTRSAIAQGSATDAVRAASPSTVESTRPGLIIWEGNLGSGPGICQMRGDGTEKHMVVPYDPATEGIAIYPEWSPDGQHFTCNYGYQQEGQQWEVTWVADRDGSHGHAVGQPAEWASSWWLDSNTLLLYSEREEVPLTQTYQLDTGVLTEGGLPALGIEGEEVTWSPDQARVAIISTDERELSILDRGSGQRVTVFTVPDEAEYGSVRGCTWSPDGQRLAFTCLLLRDNTFFADLHIADANSGLSRQLTDLAADYRERGSPTSVLGPTWSPDGEWLAFHLDVEAQGVYLAVVPAQRGQVTNLNVDCTNALGEPVWSPDSRELAFISNRPFADGRLGDNRALAGQWDIFAVDIHTRAVRRLTNDSYMEMHIDWR